MPRLHALLLPVALLAAVACTPPADSPSTGAADPAEANWSAEGWVAKSLPELAEAIRNGEVTSEALTQAYLDRIARIDHDGPRLQSVLALNPQALEDARARDAAQAAGEELGPLHGIPVLLKDNIESLDPVATTAGALALKDNVTNRDSPLVAGLRAAGAVILGKTNLSQWANFRSNDSMSGWSALGGQVRNPHILDRNPCGSSSGSGAAVAASLGAGAVGTETNGSIICPSNVNGVVGFKPTVGLVSQRYIVPISSSQDTAGPMTKTVTGAAMMLNAMQTDGSDQDFLAALSPDALQGVRVGVLRDFQGSNDDIVGLFEAALEELEAAGAELVDIEGFDTIDGYGRATLPVMMHEFKATLNEYLADAAPAVVTRDLDSLIAFNEEHADVELALFDQSIFIDAAPMAGLDAREYLDAVKTARRGSRDEGIDKMLTDHDVQVLVSPSGPLSPRVDPVNGDVWPSWAGGGSLAAVAGYPHVTVPMGTVHGIPIGLSLMGTGGDDANILAYGFAYEQRTHHRADPGYLRTAEDRPEIAEAMRRK